MNSNKIGELRKELDKSNMYDVLKGFTLQAKEACDIGRKAPQFAGEFRSLNFAILGMGGSAIGGSLVRSYFNALPGASQLNIDVNRNYHVPVHYDENTNFIVSSYSGNTEETLSAMEDALLLTKNIVCITSGGTLAETAAKKNLPHTIIPGGLQPRCALAYSLFPLLFTFINNGLLDKDAVQETEAAIAELMPLLEKRSACYSDYNSNDNEALRIAEKLHGKIPVIYSADERLDSVNIRWRNQIQENAKNHAFGSFLPEMNHNEINGWTITPLGLPRDVVSRFSVLVLSDREDNPRVSLRYEFLRKALEGKAGNFMVLTSDGHHLLTRMMDLIYLGDWVSYYLALLNGIDPTPIPMISELKEMLANADTIK